MWETVIYFIVFLIKTYWIQPWLSLVSVNLLWYGSAIHVMPTCFYLFTSPCWNKNLWNYILGNSFRFLNGYRWYTPPDWLCYIWMRQNVIITSAGLLLDTIWISFGVFSLEALTSVFILILWISNCEFPKALNRCEQLVFFFHKHYSILKSIGVQGTSL